MSFFTLPAELRIIIYDLVLNDGLDLPYNSTDIVKSGHTGIIPYKHWKQKAKNLTILAMICRQIKSEAVDPFYHSAQLYIHYKIQQDWSTPGGPFTDYERMINLIGNKAVFREARHVRMTVYPGSDEVVWYPYSHKELNLAHQRFSPQDGMRPFCASISNSWLADDLKNLETLHMDVNYKIDWILLRKYSKSWLYECFNRVKKLTLSLNFEGKEVEYEKARNSRYVKRGKPQEMMEANILNHILTLPEDHWKDAPDVEIKDHFGAIDPEWPRLPKV
ncbi:hypothetical protein B0T20DRAFT_453318 [Sordaria brevicollis]|uniref:Uncharacterized protein n=1 Tax=Sordaria brevicollis TaxID=83679 RepID=A0AAE0UC01_SORBR|nr:hypothetical protein B0T20DRAFT_453318 [Sordaria brevicollis]